ncbi:MAG: hypothetical protein ACLR23_03990 [Clostridia bacterium]
MDFVPLHFVSDFYALHQFDGSFLYESERETERYSPWNTILFDYSKPHVISFMKSALDFWLSRYHFDGVRFDAVSNLIYRNGHKDAGLNEPGLWFLRDCNFSVERNIHRSCSSPRIPLITSKLQPLLSTADWALIINGILAGCTTDWITLPPLEWSPADLGQAHILHLLCVPGELYPPLSHDEVVHGKKSILDRFYGSYEEKFHQLRTYYLYMISHPGKKLLFMGNELAEFKEWDESKELAWNLLDSPSTREVSRLYGKC